jgi:periplasmic mercuric ion binding protein
MTRSLIPILAAVGAALAAPAWAAERTVTLAVDNMTCALCPPIVKKSLARVPGVTRAEVSAETHRAMVTFDDSRATVAALVNATTNAGYPSRPVQ